MFGKTKSEKYVSDITMSGAQQKFLVNQVISQLRKFYDGVDSRKMVLEAFTGSGKTTVTVKELIPKFIKEFNGSDKRVICFISPGTEVVESAYAMAKAALNDKEVAGNVVRVYNSDDINKAKKDASRYGASPTLSGDVVVVFLTASYFYYNYDLITSGADIDLMIVDEAHLMFGTSHKDDTEPNKGVHNEKFQAKILDKLYALKSCANLFLTATPTQSQKMCTEIGLKENILLKPMPRDILTTPFFQMVSYLDFNDTLIDGIEAFKKQCETIAKTMGAIDDKTWKAVAPKITPTYPALMIRSGRSGAKNGTDLEKYIDTIRKICALSGFKLFISTAKLREFDGIKVGSLQEGIVQASKISDVPVVVVVIESGSAGLDYVKLNNVIISRNPSSPIHNNWSQTAGRSARMKFGFRNHAEAAEAIQSCNVSDEQKLLLTEYYVLHSTSTIHVPVDSEVLNIDVKAFIESESFRPFEGREYMLSAIFGDKIPTLRTKTILEENSYKRFQKTYCEVCNDADDGETHCYHSAWKAFESLTGVKLLKHEMDMLWFKTLHTHHVDGNHFNNHPDNRKTICPNVHGVVTMYNQDYNNRYDDVRRMLSGLAKKKKGNPNIVNLCFQ